jgi:putative GTP pyrophosphokinase
MEDYGLDMHCRMILEEYRQKLDSYEIVKRVALEQINNCLKENRLFVSGVEARIKEESSLAGKLALKGSKYASILDLTDIVGTRVITFYSDDVDKVAALIQGLFDIDWANSIDKRKMHELDSFGYMSLHYICRIPAAMFQDPDHPDVNVIRFELQMRTALQHVWATIYHDSGYKSDIEVPVEYLRNLNRIAGMLELADEQFSRMRKDITDYRRGVQSLVASGNFNDVSLDGDSYASYLSLHPFRKLAEKIASINQAEIFDDSLMPYLSVFKHLGFKTLGDIEKMKADYSDDAYRLSAHQIGSKDLDILAASLAVRNLCIVYMLKVGAGEPGLVYLFDLLDKNERNPKRAQRIIEQAKQINLI